MLEVPGFHLGGGGHFGSLLGPRIGFAGGLAGGLGFGLLTGSGFGKGFKFFSSGLDFFFGRLEFGDFLGEFF